VVGPFCTAVPEVPASELHTPPHTRLLGFPSHQPLYRSAVEGLPCSIPYSCPRLSEVGCSLGNLVAREHDQLEGLCPAFRTLMRPVLDPHQRCR
jgi:hypothetical protein